MTYLEGVPVQDLLIQSRTDALLMPRTDLAHLKHPRITPIFPDVAAAQRRYFDATGIFPIMHFIVMRRELAEGATPAQWAGMVGEDPWTYGIEANRHVLETFLRYAREEGLMKQARSVDELFTAS